MRERPLRSLALAAIFLSLSGCLHEPSVPNATGPRHWEAFLWNEPYETMRITVNYAPGFVPTSFALEALVSIATNVTGKFAVRLEEPRELEGWAGQRREWSFEDLDRVIDSVSPRGAGIYGAGTEAFLEVYYLEGTAPTSGAVGLMVDGRAFLFTTNYLATLSGNERFERHALVHEFGHALGLVDCGIPMLTPRLEGNCHSSRRESVMSTAAVSVDAQAVQEIAEDDWVHWRFDEADLADIQAFQLSLAKRGDPAGNPR